jgi:hypothetical protein
MVIEVEGMLLKSPMNEIGTILPVSNWFLFHGLEAGEILSHQLGL